MSLLRELNLARRTGDTAPDEVSGSSSARSSSPSSRYPNPERAYDKIVAAPFWPELAGAEEVRSIADDVRRAIPELKTTLRRTPIEREELNDAEAAWWEELGDQEAWKEEAAKKAAENIADEIHEIAASNFADLSERLSSRHPNDPKLPAEIAELKVLRSGIRAWIEPTDENEQLFRADRKSYADALLQQVDTMGIINEPPRTDESGEPVRNSPTEERHEIKRLIKDFENYFEQINDNPVLLAAATRAIDDLGPPRDKNPLEHTAVEQFAVKLSARLGGAANKLLRSTPKLERTYTTRAPNDVLVHLMSAIRSLTSHYPDEERLQELGRRARAMFMTHAASTESVRQLIEDAKQIFASIDATAASGTAEELLSQLPAAGAEVPRTQAQENIYGRVFESKLMEALVKDPPEEFLAIAHEVGMGFGSVLTENDEANIIGAREAGRRIGYLLPRPWSEGVPTLEQIAEKAWLEAVAAELDEAGEEVEGVDAGDTLRIIRNDLLSLEPTTGQEMIAATFVMVHLSLAITDARRALGQPDPEWMIPANEKYASVIRPQRDREFIWSDVNTPTTDAVGLTLLHQPAAAHDERPTQSTRSAAEYRFGIRSEQTNLDDMHIPAAIRTAHERAIPFASGVSGTTNILLHLLHYLKTKKKVLIEVPSHSFVLMLAMHLGYDGGHSLHEVLWVANMLDQDLSLGLNLGDPMKPAEFVGDYAAFVRKFDGKARAAVDRAVDVALDGMQDYLEEHSFFAKAPDGPNPT
jgi:hypothetical protein